MTSFQVVPSGLHQAAATLDPGAGSLASTSVPVPDAAMYGQLVGSAAADAEPATTAAFNDLISALSGTYAQISAQLIETGRCYTDHEDELDALIRSAIEGMLR